MSTALPGIGVLSTLNTDRLPVWGIDPSTKRVSVGIVHADRTISASTLSLPSAKGTHRFGAAYLDLSEFFVRLRDATAPSRVMVEQPFAQGRRVHPSSQQMLGVVLAALSTSWLEAELIGPPSWKKTAMGKGNGFAKPVEYLRWAQEELGYRGTLEDEAAALGVAVACAVSP